MHTDGTEDGNLREIVSGAKGHHPVTNSLSFVCFVFFVVVFRLRVPYERR